MDKNTLSEYGWIVIVIILLALILAFLPLFNNLVIGGASDYVEGFFGETDDDKQLQKPSLLVRGSTLVIMDGSGLADEYEVTVDGVGSETVDAEHPETEYDLSDLEDGAYVVSVIAKAYGLEDSKPATTTIIIGGSGTTPVDPPSPPTPGTLAKPSLVIVETTLAITKGTNETERYEISINGEVAETVSADSPTYYDLSDLSVGTYVISVIAKADGWADSAAATIDYTVDDDVITQEDIDNSGGKLVAIGKTNPLYVIAQFNDDFTSVTIFKNGADSDGVMRDFSVEDYSRSLLATITIEPPAYIMDDWYRLYNYVHYEQEGRLLEDSPHAEYGSYGFDYNGDEKIDSYDTEDLLYWLMNDPAAEGTVYATTTIEAAIIEDGVVNLGDALFQACENLKTVTISDSVVGVGSSAFDVSYGGYLTSVLTAINFEAASAPSGFADSGYPTTATINYNVK